MRDRYAKIIWASTLIIIFIGLVTLYSAAHNNVRVSSQVFYNQLTCAVAGIVLMYAVSLVDYRKLFDGAYAVYGVSVVLLLLVALVGRHALGATRWISIAGFNFQPSEFAKAALILALGRYFSQRRPSLSFSTRSTLQRIRRDLLVPLGLTLLPMAFIFKQPDLGTSLLLFGIFVAMVYVSGIELKVYGAFLAICTALVPFGWHFLKAYQKDRLLVFLNPNIDPLGAGYTIIQSKIAIGSGRLFGKGWLAGTQNQLNFLPERHTDFIFSVIGEEWGLVGTWFVVLCFFMLILCGVRVAEKSKEKFGRFVAVGIVTILTLQVVINIGMVMGLSPVVGLTLPFVSYGRSSFIVMMLLMGILVNLSRKRMMF